MQIQELAGDLDNFDQVRLLVEDHPVGTELAVTENQDIVVYFPTYVINPSSAILNYDSNVTCSLQYDSICPPTTGDSSDVINTSSGSGSSMKTKTASRILKTMSSTYKNVHKTTLGLHSESMKKQKPTKNGKMDDIADSMAVIFDPQSGGTDWPWNVKEPCGVLCTYDSTNNYMSPWETFARRENRSVVVVPVGSTDMNIDTVFTKWSRDYNISFMCTTPIFYGGYVESELQLISAQNSTQGDVTQQLLHVDQNYATMDSTSVITMQFLNTAPPIPDGWVRDYVLIVTGRYAQGSGNSKLSKGKKPSNNLPTVFALHQNYPNPFNPVSTIKYDLPRDVQVTIKVYDILGREVKVLVDQFMKAGYQQAQFDGTNLASGVYFYRIEAGSFVSSRKMVLLK